MASPTPTPTLCLNMIVKNESRIIERLLETVAPIIDAYCICDTGSTDDTKQKIEAFMTKRGIRGEVFDEPFKNFGYNRTVALQRAAAWADYAILLDADMKLVIGAGFQKSMLKDEGYLMAQGTSRFQYYNTRIVFTRAGVRCVGPTHEFYDFPPNTRHEARIPPDILCIDDIGDGGSKADKFERDIRLLRQGLEEEPNNGRYYFYLANSYRDLGRYTEAIEAYQKRATLGGWEEEVWNALFEMGKCYFAIGDNAKAIYTLLEAYNVRPSRGAEPLYEIVRHYRCADKKQAVAQLFCDKAMTIPYPKDDVLFIHKDVYDYLLDYEGSILAYYTGKQVDHRRYLNLLSTGHMRDNVLNNYQFYVRSLSRMPGLQTRRIVWTDRCEKMVRGRLDDFKSSSPCILPLSDGYLVNVRYVNYNLDRIRGTYSYRYDDQKIITLNKVLFLNRGLEVVCEHWMDKVHREDIRYLGVEDVKVFSHQGQLRFMGTVQDEAGRPRIGEGVYNLDADVLVPTVYPSPKNADCEKNWVSFHDAAGALKTVYNWSPLTVGRLEEGVFHAETMNAQVPGFFKDLRGSTNGCLVPATQEGESDEVWFLTHYVAYSQPRHYYHCIVVLDAKTLAVKRHSTLFKFEGEKIEYALGLVVEPTRILISYSKWDSESVLGVYDRGAFERAFMEDRKN